MASERTASQKTVAIERRHAAAAAIQRRAADATTPSAAQALRQRLGNRATQSIVSRAIATGAHESSPPAPVRVSTPSEIALAKGANLPAKAVSKPHEPSEVEAEDTARKVTRMEAPQERVAATQKTDDGPAAQRAAAKPAPAPPPAAAARAPMAGGAPLPAGVRGFMETRFGARFDNVRIHTGEAAAQQSAALGAQAFTIGEHISFGRDKFQPESASGRELIAHELTHTIQQGAAIQRSVDTSVTGRSEPRIQRLSISGALDWIAEKAHLIPGFRMLTIVLGMNPINGAPVDRSGANVLRGLLELIPLTGPLLVQALEKYGVFEKAGAWLELQIRSLGLVGNLLKTALHRFLDSLGWRDIFRYSEVWDRAKRIFTEPIDHLEALARRVVGDLIGLVRDAVLMPLARLAEGTRGYGLLKAVLGRDPITNQPVPRNAETLIGGFMRLIGQEEIWENIKRAEAVERAWAWFQGAVAGLREFVSEIPGLFVQALRSLELLDLLILPKAFVKLAGVFGGFVARFVSWAGSSSLKLLEIIFSVVSPTALRYLRRTGAALFRILRNPLPFVRNLVRAAKLGFQTFADRFGLHLKAGLIDWLTGSLPGVYIPKEFSLGEIAKFLFSVLGLTWQNIRSKLVKVVGETAVKAMETGFDIVVTLVTQGPAAAWQQIQDHLTNLKDMVIGGITDLVVDTVVAKAVPKLLSMFIPGAGFISAIVSIYDTIMVFVRKLSTIARVVSSFVGSITAIAAGAIGAAAKRVETALAGVLSLAINFLAGFAGLGNVADKVMGVIRKVRTSVDKAIDALIAWIVKAAKGLFASAKAGVSAAIGWLRAKATFVVGSDSHSLFFRGEGAAAKLLVASSTPIPVEAFISEKEPEAKGDAAKTKAISSVRSLLAEVQKARTKNISEEEKQREIERLMNEMGSHLVLLLASTEWGTEANPSPFDYPKRRAEAYPTFYLATGNLVYLDQGAMQVHYSSQGSAAKLDRVHLYRPTELTDVPDKSQKLGLGPASQIQVGSKVFFEDREKRGRGVETFKTLVRKFGFTASKSGWDVDHVVELQIGGKDEFENLWPLPKGENRSSGAKIKNSTITLPGTKKEEPVKDALAKKKSGQKPQQGLWLLIKSTHQR